MKLSEIKTDLFTRVSKTTFGFRFEIFDEENGRHQPQSQWPIYLLQINVTTEGDFFVVTKRPTNNKLTIDQLNEITRVAHYLNEVRKLDEARKEFLSKESKDD
jgi:hypothetical protein